MNLADAKTKAIQYIKAYSNDGQITTTGENQDYLLSANTYANAAQIDLAKIKKLHAVKQITQNPIPNQLGLLQGFDIVQHLATDLIDTQATGSKSYYFEVDRQATVYIEEKVNGVWTILQTINVPSTTSEFTPYKGLITASNSTNDIRIRFSGNYPYNIRNRALYAYTFPTANDVPDYKPYVKYVMPTDFSELNKVIHITDPRVYSNMIDFHWEGKRTFVVNYYYTGSFDIHYFKFPAQINNSTQDDFVFELDADAAELIPLYIAAKMIFDENLTLSMTILNEYEIRKSALTGDTDNSIQVIQDVNNWG